MGLDGGGGGGGDGGGGGILGVTGSFTGPAQQLELTANYGYAYSGAVAVSNSATDLLQFRTGNFTFVGRIYTGYCSQSNVLDDMTFGIFLNEALISARYLDTSKESNIYNMIYHTIVIPPYTEVLVQCTNVSSSTARDMGCIMTGRIYRG